MRGILHSFVYPIGFAALLFTAGCGQAEGERCQINSDCKSGLICKEGDKGNGTCRSNVSGTSDAAVQADTSPSQGPDADTTTSPDASAAEIDGGTSPAVDADEID